MGVLSQIFFFFHSLVINVGHLLDRSYDDFLLPFPSSILKLFKQVYLFIFQQIAGLILNFGTVSNTNVLFLIPGGLERMQDNRAEKRLLHSLPELENQQGPGQLNTKKAIKVLKSKRILPH